MKKKSLSALLLVFILAVSTPLTAFTAPAPASEELTALETNLLLYPDLVVDGVTQPIFDNFDSASPDYNFIDEEVYIEVPIDTDMDGKRDLVRIQIRRPKALEGFKSPVLMESSPYRDTSAPAGSPSMYPTDWFDVMHEQNADNPDTTHLQYSDVESKNPRADEWLKPGVWTDEAYSWGGEVDPFYDIPAAYKSINTVTEGAPLTAGIAKLDTNYYNYFAARGCAIIYSSSIGNQFADGLPNSTDVGEVLCPVAVIQWLNGKANAYTDRTATTKVDPTGWATGDVAMTGQSYNGTLPLGAAFTGVDGLKAIIPRAGMANWYNYYRRGGAVVAPGGYQGEDLVVHADYVISRSRTFAFWENILPLIGKTAVEVYEEQRAKLIEGSNRETGDYNDTWDTRNFLTTAENVKAAIMIQHGLNDWNVKPKHFDEIYRIVKAKTDAPVKLLLHLEAHTTIFQRDNGKIWEYTHKWLDHYLWGLENGAPDDIPEVAIANNVTGQWETFDSWPIPGTEYYTYNFGAAKDGKAGALLSSAEENAGYETFKDRLDTLPARDPGDGGYSGSTGTWDWNRFNPAIENSARLAYITQPLEEDVRLNGTATVTLNLTPDKPKGTISVALVEIGTAPRAVSSVSSGNFFTVGKNPRGTTSSVPAGLRDVALTNYSIGGSSNYKVVSRGNADVQNPNPTGKTYMDALDTAMIPEYYYQTTAITPGEEYSYTFEMEPMDYTFRAGQRVAVVVYSTDYAYTIIPTDVTGFELNLNEGSYIKLPLDKPLYHIDSFKLSGASTALGVGKTMTLTPVFTPANPTDPRIIWTSSNDKVATVKDGVVKALSAGSVTITAKTVDGGLQQKIALKIM